MKLASRKVRDRKTKDPGNEEHQEELVDETNSVVSLGQIAGTIELLHLCSNVFLKKRFDNVRVIIVWRQLG